MTTAIAILTIAALAAAAPKPMQLQFRSAFKDSIKKIPILPGNSLRIIHGLEAPPHSIPYQVFLEFHSPKEGWYCGGSLISTSYVLTAAHCAIDAIQAKVTLGAHRPLLREPTQMVVISDSIHIHEDYNNITLINDIALIKLPTPSIISDAIAPVKLPSFADADKTFTGETARISGWGLTDFFQTNVSDVLNYADMEVISNEECEEFFVDLQPSAICTSGSDQVRSCSGDSGGPLILDHVQIGVVSFGVSFCMPGYPCGFTRITSFLDWIADNSDVRIV